MRLPIILITAGLVLAASGSAQAAHRHGFYVGPSGYGADHYYRRGYRHHRRSHRRARYLVGGLVAGAVLGHVIHSSSRHRSASRTYSRPASRERGGHYLRDRYGDCYWVEEDPSGAETRTALEPEECDW